MCGLVAVLQDRPVECDGGRRALETIAHRGPDDRGLWREGNAFVGHRRLTIIDLTTGQQPMLSQNGRFVIAFNGEIYNFLELRSRLESDGVRFRTQSDTEVLLEGFCRWRPAVVDRLNGMFAFVIWDRQKSLAFGARDRLEIKPLCRAISKGALIPSLRTILHGVIKLDRGCRFH